jgi:hypothetical protein
MLSEKMWGALCGQIIPYETVKVYKAWSSFWIYRALTLCGPYCWSLPLAYFIAWNLADAPSFLNPVSHISVYMSVFEKSSVAVEMLLHYHVFLYDVYAKYWSIRSVTVNSDKNFPLCLFQTQQKFTSKT